MSDWRRKAPCRSDPSLWDDRDTQHEAIHICVSHCPVLTECRAWAVDANMRSVTAGGIAWTSLGKPAQVDLRGTRVHNEYCRVLEQAEEG